MNHSRIPGIYAVIIEHGKIIYEKGFGYSDLNQKKEVSKNTLFELGSTSKAFTGLGILMLEAQGLIDLNAPVHQYLPWFSMKYAGKPVSITIKHCLYHTSGIPFKSFGNIKPSTAKNALESAVRTLVGKELKEKPGEKFEYVTINYDILGMLIETVTGKSFEAYITDQVLTPLGLNNTYLDRAKAYSQSNMATGYKLGFWGRRAYNAPTYKGNAPAGYFITNGQDLSRWLKIQLGIVSDIGLQTEVINKSHLANRTVAPAFDGSSYAAGWFVYQDGGGELAHMGHNPNFSSFVGLLPGEKTGVAILANLNSSNTPVIGQGVIDMLQEMDPKPLLVADLYKNTDNVASIIIVIALMIILASSLFLVVAVVEVVQSKRKRISADTNNSLIGVLGSMGFLTGLAFCLYLIPDVLFFELPWDFVLVWAPTSLMPAIISILIATFLFISYYHFIAFYPKVTDKCLFPLVVLSFMSGFGNAFIIFTINTALNKDNALESGLIYFFLLGIVIYVYGQRLIRQKMITITNDFVFKKRAKLIRSILDTPYYALEVIDSGRIYNCLNNDSERISDSPNVIIDFLTVSVILVCCFIYLGMINIYGLFLSLLMVFVAAFLYFLTGRAAMQLWSQTEKTQNIFFKLINHMVHGFKELSLSSLKRRDFYKDIEQTCYELKQKKTITNLQFSTAFITGALLFSVVIGVITFIFPVLFEDIQKNILKTYVFVFLYMTGPIVGTLNSIPQLIQIKTSWKRVDNLTKELNKVKETTLVKPIKSNKKIQLFLDNITYQYKTDEGVFKLGPIEQMFRSGEVIFITGGNGSGKTTLVKLLTGLYKPDKGSIKINNKIVSARSLGEYYSTVFSDYYLFDKLYGIRDKCKKAIIDEYLDLFKIRDKVSIINGRFSTIELSGGQKKRLGLLLCYLEDKPVFLFDEWAADQDPVFRDYFYKKLLKDLKKQNKCVVVVTHDDHFFHIADRIIKLDMGMIEWIGPSKTLQETT